MKAAISQNGQLTLARRLGQFASAGFAVAAVIMAGLALSTTPSLHSNRTIAEAFMAIAPAWTLSTNEADLKILRENACTMASGGSSRWDAKSDSCVQSH